MTADAMIQDLADHIYQGPLSEVRHERDYPNLDNPLHLVILLIDCDTEIAMNGVLGFQENLTGQHLAKTTEALARVGAPKAAAIFAFIQAIMQKHGVTWQSLRGDFEGVEVFQISSFKELHGQGIDRFTDEVDTLTSGFSLVNTDSSENVYGALCAYLEDKTQQLSAEVEKRKA